jgi:hypothetical protein
MYTFMYDAQLEYRFRELMLQTETRRKELSFVYSSVRL